MSTPTPAFAVPAALSPSLPAANLLPTSTSAAPCRPVSTTPRHTRPTMAFTSIGRILTPDPVSMPVPVADLVSAVYRQVLGNAYLMESERAELHVAESQFGRTSNVRDFVRAIALSDAYKSRFFAPVSQFRFIELAFKHLMGRAPVSRAEYAAAMNRYHNFGYKSCISWFVDSEEYDEAFGDVTVPYGIYKGCYPTNEVFNRSVAMRLAPGSSDKGRSAMLQYAVCANCSPNWLSIAKALPTGTEKGTGFVSAGRWASPQTNNNAPIRVGTKVPGGVVFYE